MPPRLFSGSLQMPKFRVGDQVQRLSSILADTRIAAIKRVVPNKDGYDMFTEYEIEYADGQTATFYETQLRLIKAASDSK